jgi:hypothetical protein
MKTINKISALSLALIFATANTVISAIPENPSSREDRSKVIVFRVNIHHNSELATCGTYLVQMVDENGLMIMPPQTFVPGVSTYVFTKQVWGDGPTPMFIWKTKVTAMLIGAYAGDMVCPVELLTPPDSRMVLFMGGKTYQFDLYPGSKFRNMTSERIVKE